MRYPIVIGGIGGSGTRLVREIVVATGVWMGGMVSRKGDSLELYFFHNRFLNPLLSDTRRVDYRMTDVSPPVRRSTTDALSKALSILRGRSKSPSDAWGFKDPRSIYVLPFLNHLLPGFVFLHVIRDGRDMVLSENKRQLGLHHAALFGEPPNADLGLAQARLWNVVNTGAARWASANLPERYHPVRFEDLCNQPEEAIGSILRFLHAPASPDKTVELARMVRPNTGVGRWRTLEAARAAELTDIMEEGLARFGYMNG